MAFQDMPVGAKYALIGGIAVLITLLLILGRFLWARRRKQQSFMNSRDMDKNIEEPIINEKKPEISNSLPTLPRNTTQLPISGPVRPQDDEDHKEEYSRTTSLMPPAAAAKPISTRPHPSQLPLAGARLHPSRERQGSVHSEFSNVPTEFNIAQKSPRLLPPQQARHRNNSTTEDFADTYLPVPISSQPHSQPRSITPPSPSVYSPGIERAPSRRLPTNITSPIDVITSPITSPNDDLYVRVPRLYQPPNMAYGEAELPYSPPKRIKPHGSYQPGGSLRRKRSVSMQDPSAILRMNSNASGGSIKRKNSRRGGAGDRNSTQSEWIDTLTVIDDINEGDGPETPKRILSPATQRQLLMPRKSTVKRNRSTRQVPNPIQTSAPSSNTSWNNSIIAEQAAAIKYSTKRTRSKSPPKDGRKSTEQ
ncbi:uncharacterized protein DFL_007017 [Arthrobotrys flagrans]|uniref:Uncharacterized protein n=1 Tax=Arthrobotrys flagrans TaxID=97331 RepID=A0A436ZV14_ARTFL|nr:hypothetical protein DFL_007017 [Arthrobotrys flagrans]